MDTERAVHGVSVVEAVAETLRRDILDGAITAGSPIREVAVAADLGVGRHTLRAALGALTQQGLLVKLPHRGVFVPVLSDADAADLSRVRAALEVEAVRTLTLGGVVLARAEDRLQDMERLSGDASWSDVVDADLALHAAIVDAVGSPRLTRLHRTLAAEIRLTISQLRPLYESPREMWAEHRTLIEAIKTGDESNAIAAMRSHIESGSPPRSELARHRHPPARARRASPGGAGQTPWPHREA